MASVRITEEFRSDVRNLCGHMESVERNKLGINFSSNVTLRTNTGFMDKLNWGAHLHLKDQMPNAWKGARPNRDMRVHYTAESWVNLTVYLPGNVVMALPPNHGYYADFPLYQLGDAVNDMVATHPEVQDILDAVEMYKRKREHDAKWQKIITDVRAAFDHFTTVNQAVKAFPELAIYVPEKYKRRMEEKSGPRGKAEMNIPTIDLSGAVSAAVQVKLAGG